MLPVVLMLLFVYVFGGALRTAAVRRLRRAGTDRAVCRLRGGDDRGRRRHRHVERDRRPDPLDADLRLVDPGRSRRRQPRPQRRRHSAGGGRGAARRLADRRSPARWIAATGMVVLFVPPCPGWPRRSGWWRAAPRPRLRSPWSSISCLTSARRSCRPTPCPGALRGFAEHQPFTPIIETMRGLWIGRTSTGATIGHEAVVAVGWCVVVLVASYVASVRLFRRRTSG